MTIRYRRIIAWRHWYHISSRGVGGVPLGTEKGVLSAGGCVPSPHADEAQSACAGHLALL